MASKFAKAWGLLLPALAVSAAPALAVDYSFAANVKIGDQAVRH